MRNLKSILALGGIFLMLATGSAWSQPAGSGSGMGGQGQGRGLGLKYDPQNLETVSGEVTKVQIMRGRAKGVHLEVKTDKETMSIILGPSAYLKQHNMQITAGDKVEVKGSRVKHPSRILLIAGEVKKGDQVLKLRDDQGLPLWSRQGIKK